MRAIDLTRDRCPTIDRAIWGYSVENDCPEDTIPEPNDELCGLTIHTLADLESTDETDRADEAMWANFVSRRYNPAQFDHSTHGCDWAELYGIDL